MATFYDLPVETVEEILIHCDPLEVAAMSSCSRFCRDLIYNAPDQHLWRALYLAQPFDDPTHCVSQDGKPRTGEFNWKLELQAIIRARTVLKDVSLCKPHERTQILRTLLNMATWTPPLNAHGDILNDLSRNLRWIARVTADGVFLDPDDFESSKEEEAKEEIQLRAKLHTLIGLTPADYNPSFRLAAKGYIFNLGNYNWDTEFGPFLPCDLPSNPEDSGIKQINWVHVKHVHHVITMHLLELANDPAIEPVVYPLSYPYTQAIIPEGLNLEEEQDWAGINGVWLVSFCFVDHQVLLEYNTEDPETGGPNKSVLSGPFFQDMMHTLQMTLQVTHIKEDPKRPDRPRIYFAGVVAQASTTTITGYVRMTDDNEIRWSFLSGTQGQMIWSSEGVQVGGVRSSFGVMATWTTIFHEKDDPIGPAWLRKAQEPVLPISSQVR